MKNNKKIMFSLFILAILICLSFLYFSESDQNRLVRAYKYDNSLLCNLIINQSVRTKCVAVIGKDFTLCDRIPDDYEAFFCYLGVAEKNGNSEFGVDLMEAVTNRCNKNIPRDRDFFRSQGINLTYDELKARCSNGASFYAGYFFEYLALRNNDLRMCEKIDGAMKDDCTQVVNGNMSYLCKYQDDNPDLCLAAKAKGDSRICEGRDRCYLGVVSLTGNTSFCGLIKDKLTQEGCYLYFLEPPGLRKMNKDN